jgi:hypothetical protein
MALLPELTELAIAPGTNRIFVTEQFGRVFSFPDDPATMAPDLLVDANELVAALSARTGESLVLEGLYGLAFHPDFARNRWCYLCYAARHKDVKLGRHPHGSRVVRLTVSQDEPPRCDPASEVEIITWLQGGHKAGCLKFGSDGMLYVSTGDGGEHAPADGNRTGQDVSDLLCSILRIDVDRAEDGRAFPTRLSQTGLFTDTAAQTPATGVLPFAINAPAWADHATANYWIGIDGDGRIGACAEPELLAGTNFKRVLHFPTGMVLAKTIAMEMVRGEPDTTRRIETQILHYDGITWRGYTYAWNEA